MGGKRILVAALNWGLGHASRCIPLIRHFLDKGNEVYLASDGPAGIILQQDFPYLPYFELSGYGIRYSMHSFYFHWIKQLPKLQKAIEHEHHKVQEIMRQIPFDVIISDNRYGVYHPKSYNILITHQLNLPLAPLIARAVNAQIRRLVHRFDQCWIPDFSGEDNLSGSLSESNLKIDRCYIGPLSRFKWQSMRPEYDLCVVLSGPEPHRAMLQSQLMDFFRHSDLRLCWVLGLPGREKKDQLPGSVYNHLTSLEFNQLLNASGLVLGRSGYSSIMDYYTLRKKAILIPTPYQPEQNYLATRHAMKAVNFVPKPNLTDLLTGVEQLKRVEIIPGKINGMKIPDL